MHLLGAAILATIVAGPDFAQTGTTGRIGTTGGAAPTPMVARGRFGRRSMHRGDEQSLQLAAEFLVRIGFE